MEPETYSDFAPLFGPNNELFTEIIKFIFIRVCWGNNEVILLILSMVIP